MGREIRMVPPNWEHPKDSYGEYSPMFDEVFEVALEKYYQNYMSWRNKTHKYYAEEYTFVDYFGNPPNPNYCRPEFKEEPTWYQVYETVSEGTPITPPFETKEKLIEHLVEHGTSWDDKECGWNRESAEQFVKSKWAPSLIGTNEGIKKPGDEGFFPKRKNE